MSDVTCTHSSFGVWRRFTVGTVSINSIHECVKYANVELFIHCISLSLEKVAKVNSWAHFIPSKSISPSQVFGGGGRKRFKMGVGGFAPQITS